jgi:hypothetical protein
MSITKRTPAQHPDFLYKDGTLHFLAFPRVLIDEFFGTEVAIYDSTTGAEIKKGARLPSSFWKYTLYLLRWVTIPRPRGNGHVYETSQSARQFPVRSGTATKWTAAYAASGVIDVQLGRWTAKHDDPSLFSYHPQTTIDDWRAFIRALDTAENRLRVDYKSKAEGNTGGWRVLVALEVDAFRQRAGLMAVNTQWLGEALRETDAQGRHIARLDKDKNIVPIFYAPSKRYVPTEEEAAWGIP